MYCTIFDRAIPQGFSSTMSCPPTITLSCIFEIPEPYSTFDDYLQAGGSAESSSTFLIDTLFKLENEIYDFSYLTTITRTYSIPDYDGNFASCEQTIDVNDIEAPLLSCPPDTLITYSDKVPEILYDISGFVEAGGFVYDNCNSFYELSLGLYSDSTNNSIITRTYLVADQVGNLSQCEHKITIENPTLSDIDFSTQKLNIQTFPNPTDGNFTIQISGIKNRKIQLEIYNVNSKIVKFNEFQATNASVTEAVDLSLQPSGIYFINVTDGKNIQSNSIIIE